MKSRLETIYLKSPIWLQNIATSFYGFQLERNRHHGEYTRCFAQVVSQSFYDAERLNEHIISQLRVTLKNAEADVPYYRELFRQHRLTTADITTLADLRKIPTLNKEIIRKDPTKLLSRNYEKKGLSLIHTTGTTGTPLKIFCDVNSRRWNYAYYDRFLEQVGFNHKGKRITLGGRIIVPPNQKKPPFWRHSYYQKNLLFSSYHLNDKNMTAYIEKLFDYRPDYIDSYPSSLYAIALYAREHGIDLRGVTKGITTSAETLFPEQRELIESVFGMAIFDQYGAAEMCVFVAQCKAKNYHIHTDYGVLEFLRDDGEPADAGEEGELVCTGFINPVMPLIRYRIGDRGILSEKKCECGSVFPVVEKILGRMDDVIVTPDGRKVGRLSPVFKGFPVREVQFIQKRKEAIEVTIVRDNGYSEETEKNVIEELRKRLGNKLVISINYVKFIPRGRGGKLRSVISCVRHSCELTNN